MSETEPALPAGANNSNWTPENPHPFSLIDGELIWKGKYDAYGRLNAPAPSSSSLDWSQVERLGTRQQHSLNGSLFAADEPSDGAWDNRLYCGDNLACIAALLPEFRGRIRLIYIDPPFNVGAEFRIDADPAARSRAGGKRVQKSGTVAYSDRWGADGAYLQMMYERLTLLRELLTEDGSIYLHCDWRADGQLRLIMDEVFGADCFQNEIAWCYREAINSRKRWNRKHDTILFYSRQPEGFYFDPTAVLTAHSESGKAKFRLSDEKGRYRLMGRGITDSPIRSGRDVAPKWEQTNPELVYRHYLNDGVYPVDYWQIDVINQQSSERLRYATQKPEALLERIVSACSEPGDIVGDFFCGTGTTLAVAGRLGRRWIGCDSGRLAVGLAKKRLFQICSRVGETQGICSPFSIYERPDCPLDGTDCAKPNPCDVPVLAIEAQVKSAGKPRRYSVCVRITAYLPASYEQLDESLRQKARERPLEFIAMWGIDFDWTPGKSTFEYGWTTVHDPKDALAASESGFCKIYDSPGTKTICVRVTDILGGISTAAASIQLD